MTHLHLHLTGYAFHLCRIRIHTNKTFVKHAHVNRNYKYTSAYNNIQRDKNNNKKIQISFFTTRSNWKHVAHVGKSIIRCCAGDWAAARSGIRSPGQPGYGRPESVAWETDTRNEKVKQQEAGMAQKRKNKHHIHLRYQFSFNLFHFIPHRVMAPIQNWPTRRSSLRYLRNRPTLCATSTETALSVVASLICTWKYSPPSTLRQSSAR